MLYLLGFLSLTSIAYYLFSLYAASDFFSQPTPINPEFHPKVTILKPLCGLEWDSYDNLVSFCQQDYPDYQVIFCIQSPQDPSIELVNKIIGQYSHLDLSLVIDSTQIGNNLKISNLVNGYPQAKHDIIIISDSDIRVKPDYLKNIIQPFINQKVGVVTCLYSSLTKGWLASFEALEIATQFAPRVLTARKLEPISFACGATIAISQEVLAKIGGLQAVADYLADDYQLGYLPYQAGYQVVVSNYIVEHSIANVSFQDFLKRQARWAKCIRVERFWGYFGLIFTQGTTTSLLFLLFSGGSLLGWLVLIITWAIRLLLAWVVGVKFMQDKVTQKYFIWLPLRDIVSSAIWLYSFFGNQITWRHKKFTLLSGGKLKLLDN